ncbi:hypothetical protein UXU46_00835 (plasmid) [Campylobacter jejuni]
MQEKTALKLEDEYNNAKWANSNHAYLKKKALMKTFILNRIKWVLYSFKKTRMENYGLCKNISKWRIRS